MYKRLFQMAIKMLPIAVIPCYQQLATSCFFWNSGPSLKPNKLDNRPHIQVQVSNSPCEDRNDVLQLTSIDGYAAAVYDGHGGWQVSELCQQTLLKRLDEVLGRNKGKYASDEQLVTQSIKQAFLEVEKQFLATALLSYRYGFGRAGRAGSCALVCVVYNDRLYCGNAGDSVAILVHDDSPMGFTELNRELNANNPEQQQRLRALFPNEEDVVICKKDNNKSCYIKGRLQPTRSIGDFRLKYAEFNNPKNYPSEMEYQTPLKNFSGNYITAIPEVKSFPLTSKHRSVVLASDGLWDELGRQEVADVFRNNPIKDVPSILINKCLQKAADDAKMSLQQLRAKPQGKKRKIHDDITVIVLDLSKQVK